MLFQVAQIQFHLAFVGGFKFSNFEVDGDKAAQAAVVEKQVDVVVAVVDGDALLPRKKRKIAAQLDDETLQFGQYGRFKVFFRVTVGQAQKVEHIGVAKGEVGRELALVAQQANVLANGFFRFFGDGGALEQ